MPSPGAVEVDRRRRVLVIDDEPTVRDVVSRYLESDGYRVDSAADGRAARKLLEEPADLVILDLMLPGMDGLAFLRDIRMTSDVPVIVLTARTDEMDRVVGLELGADDYVIKPFSPRELSADRSGRRVPWFPPGWILIREVPQLQQLAGGTLQLTVSPRCRALDGAPTLRARSVRAGCIYSTHDAQD